MSKKGKKIKNVKDLRNDLLEKYENISNGGVNYKEANTLCNITSKVMSTARHEMNYNRQQKNGKQVDFFES